MWFLYLLAVWTISWIFTKIIFISCGFVRYPIWKGFLFSNVYSGFWFCQKKKVSQLSSVNFAIIYFVLETSEKNAKKMESRNFCKACVICWKDLKCLNVSETIN